MYLYLRDLRDCLSLYKALVNVLQTIASLCIVYIEVLMPVVYYHLHSEGYLFLIESEELQVFSLKQILEHFFGVLSMEGGLVGISQCKEFECTPLHCTPQCWPGIDFQLGVLLRNGTLSGNLQFVASLC